MKFINKYIVIATVGVIGLSACSDELDVSSPSQEDANFVYSNSENALLALNGVYNLFGQDSYTSRMSNVWMQNTDVEASAPSAGVPSSDRRAVWSLQSSAIVGFNDIKAVIDILKILLQVIKDAVDFFFDIRGIEADIADNEIHLYLRGVNLIFDGYAVQKDLEGDAVCFPCAHQTAQKTGIKILQFLLCLFFVGAEQFIIRDVFYFRNRVTGALSVVGITEKNQINTCFCVSYLTSDQSAALPPLMTG